MTQFKIGDKVTAVGTRGLTCLTHGQTYTVKGTMSLMNASIQVVADNGKLGYFSAQRFTLKA